MRCLTGKMPIPRVLARHLFYGFGKVSHGFDQPDYLPTIDVQILHTLSLSPLIADSIADFFSNQVRRVLVIGRLLEPQISIGSRGSFDDQYISSL